MSFLHEIYFILVLKGNTNKNITFFIWKCWFNMFQNLLQTFNIIFDIQDIALNLKQNYYAFRHLGYSYLSSDMRDVTTW